MGYLELKPAPSLASKSVAGNTVPVQNGSSVNVSLVEAAGGRAVALGTQQSEVNLVKDQIPRTKSDGRLERAENAPLGKSDLKTKGGTSANGSDAVLSVPLATSQAGAAKSLENQKQLDESSNKSDEHTAKVPAKNSAELEVLNVPLWIFLAFFGILFGFSRFTFVLFNSSKPLPNA